MRLCVCACVPLQFNTSVIHPSYQMVPDITFFLSLSQMSCIFHSSELSSSKRYAHMDLLDITQWCVRYIMIMMMVCLSFSIQCVAHTHTTHYLFLSLSSGLSVILFIIFGIIITIKHTKRPEKSYQIEFEQKKKYTLRLSTKQMILIIAYSWKNFES